MGEAEPPQASAFRARWAEQIAELTGQGSRRRPSRRSAPITVERIVATAFAIVEREGFDALTMRRIAAALDTGPASLYAHVRSKAELDDLLIGELSAAVALPEPDPGSWREQITDVCAQLRDQYLRYPGIARASLAVVPANPKTLRVNEAMLAILLAAGVPPQRAAWAIDALSLYVSAYSLEASLVAQSTRDSTAPWLLGQDELVEQLRMLPVAMFPHVVRYARELTAGRGHERFDFTIALMLDGLERDEPRARRAGDPGARGKPDKPSRRDERH